jgi:hypothetical protein
MSHFHDACVGFELRWKLIGGRLASSLPTSIFISIRIWTQTCILLDMNTKQMYSNTDENGKFSQFRTNTNIME